MRVIRGAKHPTSIGPSVSPSPHLGTKHSRPPDENAGTDEKASQFESAAASSLLDISSEISSGAVTVSSSSSSATSFLT